MSTWAPELVQLEPPRGMYPARLDDKGRLKLPVSFQSYFTALRDRQLFVTSFDRLTAIIFPIEVWRKTENELNSKPELARQARNVLFTAADLGSETTMDGQGRILFSPELRRELGIENASVRIVATRGRFEVLSDTVYEERKRRAMESAQSDMEALEGAGVL